MRLWSLHPSLLDAKGLVALWREALLAQKVLQGETRGYRNHPQLERFKRVVDPAAALAAYLAAVHEESLCRGYCFDAGKIGRQAQGVRIPVTEGQVRYEMEHLRQKLQQRDPAALSRMELTGGLQLHPLFELTPGAIESWEVVTSHVAR